MPKRFFKDSSREALLTELIIASCARRHRRHPMRCYPNRVTATGDEATGWLS
jgi:hypothetical protein